MRKFVIGTRGSKLALRQTEMVAEALAAVLPHGANDIAVEIIKTRGDKFLELSLTSQPDKGLFTREIEAKLLDGSIDMAVHSLKDLPVECVTGTTIGAYLPRAHTADVLIGKCNLNELPHGAVIGTSSRRRMYQLRMRYPHLQFKEIRGNVETRIAKTDAGEYDAIIMAQAGMERLGLGHRIREIIAEEVVVPAPGQAAIAIHVRQDDTELLNLLQDIDHADTRYEVELERELLQSLGGGCAMPFGCVCHRKNATNHLLAFFANEDGTLHTSINTNFEDADRESAVQAMISQLKTIANQ